jgi:protein MAK11
LTKDSKPQARILPYPPTKIHQIRYAGATIQQQQGSEFLAVSTEDGRILFYPTVFDSEPKKSNQSAQSSVPTLQAIGQIGEGRTNRIKDFEVLSIQDAQTSGISLVVVSGSSDGTIGIWLLDPKVFSVKDLKTKGVPETNGTGLSELNSSGVKKPGAAQDPASTASIGQLLGTYDTGNRITCLKAFVMCDSISRDTPE